MNRTLELVIVMVGCLAPMFIWAYEISTDEFFKSAAGIGMASAPLIGYRLWRNGTE
jgi:hypothetical protein